MQQRGLGGLRPSGVGDGPPRRQRLHEAVHRPACHAEQCGCTAGVDVHHKRAVEVGQMRVAPGWIAALGKILDEDGARRGDEHVVDRRDICCRSRHSGRAPVVLTLRLGVGQQHQSQPCVLLAGHDACRGEPIAVDASGIPRPLTGDSVTTVDRRRVAGRRDGRGDPQVGRRVELVRRLIGQKRGMRLLTNMIVLIQPVDGQPRDIWARTSATTSSAAW
jgi:hypothetical protein